MEHCNIFHTPCPLLPLFVQKQKMTTSQINYQLMLTWTFHTQLLFSHPYYLLEFLDPQIVNARIALIYLQLFANHDDITLSSIFQWNPN